jgi:hypothetical protein
MFQCAATRSTDRYDCRQTADSPASRPRKYSFAAGGRAVTAYPIQVHWSHEDAAWIADVPDLPSGLSPWAESLG